MAKRQDHELEAIRLYADGMEIPEISRKSREENWYVSENTLRQWRDRAGTEWQDARKSARKSQIANIEDVGARLRRSREITAQLVGSARGQSDMGMVLNQSLQTGIYDLIGQIQTLDMEDEAAVNAAIDRINILTLAVGRLETAAFRNNKTVIEIRKQALEDAADAIEKKVGNAGMQIQPETLDYIKKVIYGLA
jgi:hypothetical protein